MSHAFTESPKRHRLPSGLEVTLSSLLGDRLAVCERIGPQLSLRLNGEDASVRAALTAAGWSRSGKKRDIALLIHGLLTDETNWLWRGAPVMNGLRRSAEWTPLLVRWNTGLAVHHSAALLAELIRELVAEAGPALGRIHLIGHSLGGLLAKGLLYNLAAHNGDLLARIESTWLLATPLAGAPLARRLSSQLKSQPKRWHLRLSDGIRDAGLGFFHPHQHAALRAGAAVAEARRALPSLDLPQKIYNIAGSLWPTTSLRPRPDRHDGLVDTLSASGWPADTERTPSTRRFKELPLLAHQAVPVSSRVLDVILRWREQDR